jgi:VanZ family protein
MSSEAASILRQLSYSLSLKKGRRVTISDAIVDTIGTLLGISPVTAEDEPQ